MTEFSQVPMQEVVDYRNKIARMLKEGGLLGEKAHITMSALGLLFVEATSANPTLIAINMQQLVGIYESMEVKPEPLDCTPETDPKKLN